VTELLAELRKRNITVWREGENLRFSAPKGALTPELRAELSIQKTELLAQLDRGADPIAPLTPEQRSAGVPLSLSQERLWVLSQMDPDVANYHISHCWIIRGPLNREVLERSLDEIARRHEILRTAFQTGKDGEPIQVASPFRPRGLPFMLASAADLEGLAAAESARPFDLERGSLWRPILLRLGEEVHALLVIWHHLICDAWSEAIFTRELETLYAAFSEGRPSPLPDLPIQYGDFAAWQRQQATPERLEPHLAYWRKKLGDERPPLALPGDRPRPARQSYRGALASRALPKELWEKAQRIARAEGVTPFMFLRTVFQALLVRYTGETDICIGSPIAQRPRVETEGLIGFFLNTLALRTDFSGDPSFREQLRRVRATTLEAFEHQDASFDKVVEELHPMRQAGHHPLFQVAFVLQPAGSDTPALAGLETTSALPQTQTSKFDLTLFFEETGGALRAMMEYATDQFDAGTIERMLESLELLCEGVVAQPDVPLSRLPILSASDRERVLVEWNRTERPFPEERAVASLFEDWALKTPNATAMIDGGEIVTYGALNARANALARHLQDRGVRTGDLVGLNAGRSIRFVAGILAILKAGGAYVPLDEKEPPGRLAAMREACAFLLEDGPMLEERGDALPTPGDASGKTPAYVLFTSGSTGTPKGVIVPHQAINRLVLNCDFAQLTSKDTVAFASNVCFDAATFEIWGALLNGGRLVVTERDVLLSPTALAAHLVEHGVTAMFLTTSLFNRMAQEAPAMFRGVRHLLFGGESADAASARRVLGSGGKPERLLNVYGPTETTTFAVWHLVERVVGSSVPIGRPIANTQVYVLDATLQPVPPGVPGELYIGGPGVALGYLNEPDLTAQRFLNTEFGRVYKSGDLVRWRVDGVLEYLGRADAQIKLRGFRIEPGEIEAALLKHPGIRHAAAVIREVNGEKALAAYLVRASGAAPGEKEIREFLQRNLPVQMNPSFFVWLDAMPLTANGKLDLRALPEPDSAPLAGVPVVGPRTEVESGIADLWSLVLGRNGFSIKDDFFAVGGHSLLAIQLLGRLRERFGVDIRARQLFDTPTIEALAELIERRKAAPLPAGKLHSLVPILRGDESRRPLFLVPGGWGGEIEFLAYGQLKMHLGSHQTLYGLRARGADATEDPHRTVEEMAAAYVSEIRTLQPRGPYVIAGECIGGILAYEMARLIEAQGETVDPLILLDTELPSKANARGFHANERSENRRKFIESRIRQPAREHLDKMSHLSFEQMVAYIAKRIFRRRRKQPENSYAPDERKLLAHYPLLLMQHSLKPYGGRVTLLINEAIYATQNVLGWDQVPTGGLDIHVLPGDHLSYIREHAGSAAAKLRELIDRATPTL
jgi:amino acid adenylation domain-containing protein